MADKLRERTARLLTDYLRHCSREPGAREPQPSSDEAALLRSVAAQVQRLHWPFFSSYRGYRGNRVELVEEMAEALLANSRGLTWGHVVVLLTFAGTVLERLPRATTKSQKRDNVDRDCQLLVALLCARLTGQHRAWLEAQGGWDGFCVVFRRHSQLTFWRSLLVRTVLSWFLAMVFMYLWT